MDEIAFHVPRFRVRRLPAPELRKDPIVERWTIISTDRLGRPQEVHAEMPPTRLETCPFCAGHEHLTPHAIAELRDERGWRVRVVPNMYPALRPIDGAAHGGHEVVIECPQHEPSLANLPADQFVFLLRAYQQRVVAARQDPRLVYPMIFKNAGADAGASLEHAHSQIVLLPRLPTVLCDEIAAGVAHQAATGRCIFCDLMENERKVGERIILESGRFVALAAYAGRFPLETWILPKAHASHFESISNEEIDDLANLFRQLLRKLTAGLDDPPYNYFIHTGPLTESAMPHFHWHLELLPRITGIAGFEIGAGFAINPVPPEQAAAYLRKVPC